MASGYSDLSEIQKGARRFGVHQKPSKINLINEKPRRESLIEQELLRPIIRHPVLQPPQGQTNLDEQRFTLGSQKFTAGTSNYESEYTASGRAQLPTNLSGYSDKLSSGGALYQTKATRPTTSATKREAPVSDGQYYDLAQLEAELASKEAALKREIAYLNLYQNPWSRPPQVREPRREPQTRVMKSDQRWVKELPTSPATSRPTSRASSTKSTTESELLEKTARLLQDVEELERKPIKQQQVLIEPGSMRRNSQSSSTTVHQPSSVHTAIIKMPKGEVNNKSPLPFSYDNFSTLGVRGNIASVGAVDPEKPYPSIFPTIKRTSPVDRR